MVAKHLREIAMKSAFDAVAPKQPVVTRALLEVGGMADIYLQDAPSLRLLTEGERQESLAATVQAKPAGDVWVFGYGSLI